MVTYSLLVSSLIRADLKSSFRGVFPSNRFSFASLLASVSVLGSLSGKNMRGREKRSSKVAMMGNPIHQAPSHLGSVGTRSPSAPGMM